MFVPVAVYVYICLISELLCLGASPGVTIPRVPNVYLLQLKDINRNIGKGSDFYKMRYITDNSTFNLSANLDLGIGEIGKMGTLGFVSANNSTTRFITHFPGTMTLNGFCVTVTHCVKTLQHPYCDPTKLVAESGTPVSGAYVRLLPCVPGLAAQQFILKQDCAVGCSIFSLGNGHCDAACDDQNCNWVCFRAP